MCTYTEASKLFVPEAVIPRCIMDLLGYLLQETLIMLLVTKNVFVKPSFVKQEEKTVPRFLLLATKASINVKRY